MDTIVKLRDHEKIIFSKSLPILKAKIDFFAMRFYYYYLQSKTGQVYQKTSIQHQYQMFHTSLNMIIQNIDHPAILQEHLASVIHKHAQYKMLITNLDHFIDSFMKSIQDVFPENDEELLALWTKIITDIMSYFKDNLDLQ